MLNLHTASKLLITMGKIGKVFEIRKGIVTTLIQKAFCSQHRARLQVSRECLLYQGSVGDVTRWIMPPSLKAMLCLNFCPGPELPEFNLLSRVFLKSAQIIHPRNVTPCLPNMENSTSSYHAAVHIGLCEDQSEICLT